MSLVPRYMSYNVINMKLRSVQSVIFPLVFLLALVLPSVGPLVAHHFAERQPHHHHLGLAHVRHSHGNDQLHPHSSDRDLDVVGQTIALYNYEHGLAATTIVVVYDWALESFRLFAPTSTFTFPSNPESMPEQQYTAPTDRPPQHLLKPVA